MKIKLLFIYIISILLLISLLQVILSLVHVTSLPPYAHHSDSLYRSGYFSLLDKKCSIIADAFLHIKSMSQPEYAWIYLQDIKKKYKVEVKIFNKEGYNVTAPKVLAPKREKLILGELNSLKPQKRYDLYFKKYRVMIPLFKGKTCAFCHKKAKSNNVLGAITCLQPYDSSIYFSYEKGIFFFFISLLLSAILFYLFKWEPGRNIKELFDKK